MKQPDAPQFVNAIIKEIIYHVDQKHWELVLRDKVPRSQTILPSGAVHEAQMGHRNKASVQMEGKTEHTWRPSTIRHKLHRDALTRC